MDNPDNQASTFDNLKLLVQEALALQQQTGVAAQRREESFSQRNPALGPMVRCPWCRTRRRQFSSLKCCSAKFKIENESSVSNAFFAKKRKNPRLTRKNPPLFLMKQILLDLEAHPEKIGPMQSRMISRLGLPAVAGQEVRPEHLANFVEKFLLWEKKNRRRARNARSSHSRKINAGYRTPGSRP